MVQRLVIGQVAHLGVRRETADANTSRATSMGTMAASGLCLVDEDDRAVLLRKLLGGQRPSVIHQTPERTCHSTRLHRQRPLATVASMAPAATAALIHVFVAMILIRIIVASAAPHYLLSVHELPRLHWAS